jgi:hypothetical protein
VHFYAKSCFELLVHYVHSFFDSSSFGGEMHFLNFSPKKPEAQGPGTQLTADNHEMTVPNFMENM